MPPASSMQNSPMKITQAFTFEAAQSGWVIDFYDVEAIFQPLLERLDHHTLNDVAGLENPTAENIAAWIWHRAKEGLPGLASVRVYETPMSWAEYAGE